MVGTPSTMSPEAARGEELDGRADIYSLGCMVYELLTVEPVFDSENPMDILMSHLRDKPEPVGTRYRLVTGKKLDGKLEKIIMSCLAKDRNKRPADCGTLLSLLERGRWAEAWTANDARRWWHEQRPDNAQAWQCPAFEETPE